MTPSKKKPAATSTQTSAESKQESARASASKGGSAKKKKSPTKPDEMSGEVMEFITAIDEYKRIHQRPFPSWSEVLEILKELGYSRSA